MKLITTALVCLLLAAMWPQDATSKSSECWDPCAWAQGGEDTDRGSGHGTELT